MGSYLFKQGDPVTHLYIAVNPSTTIKTTFFRVTKNLQEDLPSFYSNAKAIFKDPRKESIGNNPLFSKNTSSKLKKIELEVAGELSTFGLEDIVSDTLVHSYSV